jgi:hypothetical protein
MSLERIKELKIKAETAKALADLADDTNEKKHFAKLLDNYKKELMKFLSDDFKPKETPQSQEQSNTNQIPKTMDEIATELKEIEKMDD